MRYFVSPSAFMSAFPVPSDAVDKYIKLASAVQLKVLLAVMRNHTSEIIPEKIAELIGADTYDVEDALVFWKECGALSAEGESQKSKDKKTVLKAQKPSRDDVSRRGAEDPKVRMLLREAQVKFSRNLKSNEAQTLLWLYDDEGMDISVILLLLQYAASQNKCNISFIEKTAARWLDKGIETITDAENEIAEKTKAELAFKLVIGVFGIDKRSPSEKELALCDKWVNAYGFDRKLLKAAYDACVDSSAKFSFAYTDKIIESWHSKGVKTVSDAENIIKSRKNKSAAKNDFAAYDIDAFESKLNSD